MSGHRTSRRRLGGNEAHGRRSLRLRLGVDDGRLAPGGTEPAPEARAAQDWNVGGRGQLGARVDGVAEVLDEEHENDRCQEAGGRGDDGDQRDLWGDRHRVLCRRLDGGQQAFRQHDTLGLDRDQVLREEVGDGGRNRGVPYSARIWRIRVVSFGIARATIGVSSGRPSRSRTSSSAGSLTASWHTCRRSRPPRA